VETVESPAIKTLIRSEKEPLLEEELLLEELLLDEDDELEEELLDELELDELPEEVPPDDVPAPPQADSKTNAPAAVAKRIQR
jgi:hypothetical protein